MMMERDTGHLANLTLIGGHYTDPFAWWQTAQSSSLYKFTVSRGPCFLDQCTDIAAYIKFLLILFK